MIPPKIFLSKNIEIKLISRTWMSLKSSVVLSRPSNLCSLNDLNSLNNLGGLNDLNSLISPKNFLNLMVGSFLVPK